MTPVTTTGPAPAAISADLSVADAAPGQDHIVSLAVHGQAVPGLGDQLATTVLDRELAKTLADNAATISGYLSRSTPLQQRIAAGERLSTAVLSGEVAQLWTRYVKVAAAGHRLRVRLDVQPSQLRALPWELLRSDGNWLFLQPNISAWRGPEPLPATDPDTGPLRVLLVVCNPLDHSVLADDELAMITSELASRLGQAFVEILDGPSRPGLSEAINNIRPHVLHFIGHGMPRIGDSYPELHFNWIGDQSAGQATDAKQWGLFSYDIEYLYQSKWRPRLVVINACRTANDPLDPIGGFAEAFLAEGTRAVVSMQADIESPAAVLFSAALYKGLGDFVPLDEIVVSARRRLRVDSMDSGDNGEWALPVLAANTDPADALRVCFTQKTSASCISDRIEYDQLRGFLDRSAERRDAWWALDPQPGLPASRPVLVIGGRPVEESRAGKTWFTHWCLVTCFLRGHRVTYVDLAKPLSRPGKDGGRQLSGPHKDWLDVVRAIRDACTSDRQLQPLPADAFDEFNALIAGRPRKGQVGDAPHPEKDEWQPFTYDRRRAQERANRAQERPNRVCSEFLTALRRASAGCPHIIALDNVDFILPTAFDSFVYPGLIRPLAEDMQSTIRLMVVAADDWLGRRLPEVDRELFTSVRLEGFDPAQFMRLARDYCHRLGYDTEKALQYYEIREQYYIDQGTVPLSAFSDSIKGISRAKLARTP